ncbi:MAG: hypothetical protein A2145_03630 [candidate division Zixibacteria bacterium RBG_16_40_9]|nr:MAG: hypothetical protein A2145_03630 [candidate division Zixibacteria bacterium RBG_16_40_9]
MKILAINWQDISNPQAGGAEVHLTEILTRLAREGHSVTLLCSRYNAASKLEEKDGIRIIRTGGRYTFNWVLPFKLLRLLKNEKFDIILEDINKIPFYSPLFHKLPVLVVIPHLFSDSVFKEINFILGLYIYLSEKPVPKIYKGFKFMVISESTKKDLVSRNIPAENILVVECGIDHGLYRFEPEEPKFEIPTIIYLGRIKKYKSVDDLIKAMPKVLEKIPEAELLIVGDGDYKPVLEKLVKDSKLSDKVTFMGYVSKEQKVKLLQKAWVSVYPSLKEGWGLTNIEANACGTPVIASDVPGLRDSVLPGKSGLLFDYGNIENLASVLIQILSDQNLRNRLIQGGLEWAKKFSWEKTADKSLEIIENILNQKKV